MRIRPRMVISHNFEVARRARENQNSGGYDRMLSVGGGTTIIGNLPENPAITARREAGGIVSMTPGEESRLRAAILANTEARNQERVMRMAPDVAQADLAQAQAETAATAAETEMTRAQTRAGLARARAETERTQAQTQAGLAQAQAETAATAAETAMTQAQTDMARAGVGALRALPPEQRVAALTGAPTTAQQKMGTIAALTAIAGTLPEGSPQRQYVEGLSQAMITGKPVRVDPGWIDFFKSGINWWLEKAGLGRPLNAQGVQTIRPPTG